MVAFFGSLSRTIGDVTLCTLSVLLVTWYEQGVRGPTDQRTLTW